MQPQHLKELLLGTTLPRSEEDLLEQLTRLVNRCAAGKLPPHCMAMLVSAPVFALAKKGGGVRPIGVGETLRRTVSKCMCAALQTAASAKLSPTQVGVAERNGCEAIVHATTAVLAEHADEVDMVMCKIDFSNAFNRVSRQFVDLVRTEADFSGAHAWVAACYGQTSSMWWEGEVIDCVTGVQQGDPLGPLLFSLVLKLLTDRIEQQVPTLALNVWYLDDGTLIGKTADVLAAVELISTEGPALGLHVNLSQCELWWGRENPRMHEFSGDIRRIATTGVALLGSAVGDEEFLSAEFTRRSESMRTQLQRVADLEHSQFELCLIRMCLGVPQLVYALRTMAPQAIGGAVTGADQAITAALEHVVGDTLSARAREQAALPIRAGGLGVREAAITAEPAYLSSCSAVRPLVARILQREEADMTVPVGVTAALAVLNNRADATAERSWTVEKLLSDKPSQQQLLTPLEEASFERLLSEAGDDASRAWLHSVSGHGAGAWLSAVPFMSLTMASMEYAAACQLRLRMDTHAAPVCPVCRGLSDPFGQHATTCATTNDRISRHNTQCDVMAATARAAAKSVVREHKGLLPRGQERPGDVTVADWVVQQTGVFDVTVVSPCATSVVKKAAAEQGHAAEHAELRKIAKYRGACELQGMCFIPVAVETGGAWGVLAQEAFKRLSRMLAQRSGKLPSEELRWMYQRHSVALQRDNARMILRRASEYNAPG